MPPITYIAAMRSALRDALAENPRVFLMGEDIGAYGGVFRITSGLQKEFGADRVRDTPISEGAFVGAALGAAMCGYRPVVEVMYVDFTLVALDQIINQVAKMRFMSGGQFATSVTILTQGGAGKGNAAQHSQSLETIFAHTPGLKVLMPATVGDAYHLLSAAILDDAPTIVIAHKLLFSQSEEVNLSEASPSPDQAVIRRAGRHITLVAWSAMVGQALAAAERLAASSIEAEVIDLRSLRPLDLPTIQESVEKTNRSVVIQEAPRLAGFGAEVAADLGELMFDHLDSPVIRVAGSDTPVPYAVNLETAAIPSSARIAQAAMEVLNDA